MINYAILPAHDLQNIAAGTLIKDPLLKNEIKGVTFDHFTLKGKGRFVEESGGDHYVVLLFLKTDPAILIVNEKNYPVSSESIVRIPYGAGYEIRAGDMQELHFLRIRKHLNKKDIRVITEKPGDHNFLYSKPFSACPVYTEDIKSEKTVNRMMLPEGLVPRFCMGSVETTGPDEVGEHDHPMLDQVFLGQQGCRCTVHADGKKRILTEDMLLHVPLGSKHSVTVEKGDKLSYIWMDFFLSLEGQKYMEEQHHLEDE